MSLGLPVTGDGTKSTHQCLSYFPFLFSLEANLYLWKQIYDAIIGICMEANPNALCCAN
jgi:hypothetical protein